MSFDVKTIPFFDRQVKRLARKFPSIKLDLAELARRLQENPEQGKGIGQSCYKIRLAVRSKGKGKSGGARVITHVHVVGENVYLLTIYDKSEKEDLADGELEKLLAGLHP